MKPGIHPTWYPDALVTCACGNTWTTGSTKKEIHTDVCNKCHPFFTGEQRIVDTAGQVERFMKRINAKEQIAAALPPPEDKKAKQEKRRERKSGTTVSLKPAVQAPAELPLAVVADKPVVAKVPPALPIVEEPVSQIQEIKFAEPVAQVEEPAHIAKVEKPAPVAEPEAKVEEPAPVAAVEEPAPMAMIEESATIAQVEATTPAVVVEEIAPVAAVEVPAPEAVVEKSTPVAVVEETAPVAANALTVVEGIGPKIASVLKTAGIATLEQLANTSVDKLNEVLKTAGINMADPATWPEQAKLAAAGKIDELRKLQDELTGGRRVEKSARKPATKKATTKDVDKKAALAKPKASPVKKEKK